MSAFAPYGRVWRAPHVPALYIGALIGRLLFAMQALGVVLFVEERTGSFGKAGIVTAAGTLAGALGQPAMGRLMRRRGQTPVLLGAIAVFAVGEMTLIALGLSGAPLGALAAAAFLAGCAVPPLSAALRGLWDGLLDDEQDLRSALALDAIGIEIVFITGPVLAAAVVAAASPAALLGLTIVLTAAGTLLFAAQPPSRQTRGEPAGDGHVLGPLAYGGVRTQIIATFAIGTAFGSFEVALPAFADLDGAAAAAGFVFAAQAAGSAVGGLWYGARATQGSARQLYLVLIALLGPALALLALADTLWQMLLLAAIGGVVIAPATAAGNEMIGTLAPKGMVTESVTWNITSVVCGVAVGAAVAGALVEGPGWRAAVLAPCGLLVLAAATVIARRRTLEPIAA